MGQGIEDIFYKINIALVIISGNKSYEKPLENLVEYINQLCWHYTNENAQLKIENGFLKDKIKLLEVQDA